jgi:hypothetical protein
MAITFGTTIKQFRKCQHENATIDSKCGGYDRNSQRSLLRKKWMNALYQHVVFHGDEQDLPEYLLGWRYERLTQPLIQILREDEDF